MYNVMANAGLKIQKLQPDTRVSDNALNIHKSEARNLSHKYLFYCSFRNKLPAVVVQLKHLNEHLNHGHLHYKNTSCGLLTEFLCAH